MRGLSERAPQFLRDRGEQGGSGPARLRLLPTVFAPHPGPAGSPSILPLSAPSLVMARARQGHSQLRPELICAALHESSLLCSSLSYQ